MEDDSSYDVCSLYSVDMFSGCLRQRLLHEEATK